MTDWNGKRVLVIGAARQGQALARWLAHHGAYVTLSDMQNESDLASARQALANTPIEWALGGHPHTLLDDMNLVCLSGGVPLTISIVVEAQNRGIPLSNDTQIFLQTAPCKTIGITGSAGKTTTTALVGEMAKKSYSNNDSANHSSSKTHGRVYVGGNIGDPLINYVDQMKPDDLAILEISSFQLDQMTISPNIAAILNITPNHLDRHGSMEAYIAAKARILDFQQKNDIAVLGRDDPGAWNMQSHVHGSLYTFGLSELKHGQNGTYMSDGLYHLQEGSAYILLPIQNSIHLRGDHNRLNVLAATTIGYAAGLSLDAMLSAIDEFHGMPHRLELVRQLHGVKWFNDSIATAPERTMAAIRSFDEPIVLMLGGRDKNLPWEDLVSLIRKRVDHVVVFGQAASKILNALGTSSSKIRNNRQERPYSINHCENLQDAINQAATLAKSGDVVLLSPGGTSFDQFHDFAERGEWFRKWVQELS